MRIIFSFFFLFFSQMFVTCKASFASTREGGGIGVDSVTGLWSGGGEGRGGFETGFSFLFHSFTY